MKNFLKYTGKKIGRFISLCLNINLIYQLYNFIYENSSNSLVRIFVRFIDLPNKDYEWQITLLNHKKIVTKIKKDDVKTAEFALSYKWHSISLNNTEVILNKYYSNETPWIDVGANLGLRSLYALSENRPVYFIEPNKELNKINVERCILNKFSNYTFFEYGASDKGATILFFIDDSTYNSTLESALLNKEETYKEEFIKVETLDNLLKYDIDKFKCACIKIDVEGHELKVLDGAKEIITKLSPTMIVEVNNKGEHFIDFVYKTKGYGYTIYEINNNFGTNKYFRKLDTLNNNYETIKSNDFLLIKDFKLMQIIDKYSIK